MYELVLGEREYFIRSLAESVRWQRKTRGAAPLKQFLAFVLVLPACDSVFIYLLFFF